MGYNGKGQKKTSKTLQSQRDRLAASVKPMAEQQTLDMEEKATFLQEELDV